MDTRATLEAITRYNTADAAAHKKIIVLYEEKIFNIGDCCIRFDKLKYLRELFIHAGMDINFNREKKNDFFYEALLQHNPHVDQVSALSWPEIDFEKYDTVICAMYDEAAFLAFLSGKYGARIASGSWPVAVYSISELILIPSANTQYVFPKSEDLMHYIARKGSRPGELYITAAERKWADEWLEAKGMRPHESLFIVLDSTRRKEKLLNMPVYFELLGAILQRPDVKLLVYDEQDIGKEEFYAAWLGGEKMKKMIFSKKLPLRQDLSLLASHYTRCVFGPCTGLLHCASSIYNHYVQAGMARRDVPLLITYTGQYPPEEKNAYTWWKGAPLVNCLLLRRNGSRVEIALLADLSEEEKEHGEQIACSEYTTPMLLQFIGSRLLVGA